MAGLQCRPMKLGEVDRSGRRRPEAPTDADFIIEADQIIAAIGQTCDAKKLLGGVDVSLKPNG